MKDRTNETNSLKWQDEPTDPGWYWVGVDADYIAELDFIKGHWVFNTDHQRIRPGVRFAGPLKPPLEPKL